MPAPSASPAVSPTTEYPQLDSPYPLSAASIDAYRNNGWVIVRGLATPEEIAAYRPLLWDVTMKNNRNTKPMSERDTYGKAFIQVTNLWEKDANARRFTLAKRFARVAAELMGVDGVRLYHDQALYKEAGGGHTPWHQDQQYWPLDGVKTCTLWMPLVDADESMGTMRFANTSQNLGYLGHQPISDDSEERWSELIQEKGYEVEPAGAMKAGDVTFHNGWTLHGAPGNASPTETREVMTIIYLEDGARLTAPDSANRENDLKSWFPGLKPGDLAAGEKNPLLWKRGE